MITIEAPQPEFGRAITRSEIIELGAWVGNTRPETAQGAKYLGDVYAPGSIEVDVGGHLVLLTALRRHTGQGWAKKTAEAVLATLNDRLNDSM